MGGRHRRLTRQAPSGPGRFRRLAGIDRHLRPARRSRWPLGHTRTRAGEGDAPMPDRQPARRRQRVCSGGCECRARSSPRNCAARCGGWRWRTRSCATRRPTSRRARRVGLAQDGKETQMTDASLPCRLTCAWLRTAADLLGAGKDLLVSAATHQPLVALTIDDGPHPSTTPALLDVLDRHEAQATFFLIGERAAHRDALVGAIVGRGHQLGNHLWRDRPSVRLPREQFRHELRRVHEELRSHDDVSVFRPGSGWFTPQMLRDASQLGYRCVLGSPWLLATEYRGDPVMQGRRLGLRAHAGAIAVLHEGTDARRAVAVVADALLTALTDRGLRAVTVRDLLTAATRS